jgi:hypothetical protein
VKNKQGLQRPSERLLAAKDNPTVALDSPGVTFQTLAVGLMFKNYSSDLVKKGCQSKMAQIKQGLGYDTAPELERLLIDEIALCWLRMGEAEAMYSQIMSGTHDADKATYAERRLSACLKRYTRGCESLARLRRSSNIILAVQVNVSSEWIVGRGKQDGN